MSTEGQASVPCASVYEDVMRVLIDRRRRITSADGKFGPMTASNLIAERILRLPKDEARAEIAILVRTLWEAQATLSRPLYPDDATRARWATILRAIEHGDSPSPGGE